MSRIDPVARSSLGTYEALIDQVESSMGYLPNDLLALGHWPELLPAVGGLVQTVLGSGELDPGLKRLIGVITSNTQGCQYCKAHAGHAATELGLPMAKIEAVYEFESSPLFTDAERSALRLAWHGALQPNAVTDNDMAEAKQHFSDREIVEIVSAIALYGFLNRLNSTLATELEPKPTAFLESLTGD